MGRTKWEGLNERKEQTGNEVSVPKKVFAQIRIYSHERLHGSLHFSAIKVCYIPQIKEHMHI